MNPLKLSNNDKLKARSQFNLLIKEVNNTLTIILILGNNIASKKAKEYIIEYLKSDSLNNVAIQFVFCDNSDLILIDLQKLEINLKDLHHPLNWANYHNYTLFAISPFTRNICDVLTEEQIISNTGLIKTSIFHAQSSIYQKLKIPKPKKKTLKIIDI